MKRKIIEINQELCNGCGLCAQACHEGAIAMVNGKAQLINDAYCDGLGNCLPECPTHAITILEKETVPFDEKAVQQRQASAQVMPIAAAPQAHRGCPGSAERSLQPIVEPVLRRSPARMETQAVQETPSELRQWPVQIKLVNPQAQFLKKAHLLIAADCTAYAYADFHQQFMRGRVTIIGCPKLDDNQLYTERFTEILQNNDIQSICVVRMEVPCCSGIVGAVKRAMLASGTIVPYQEVVIKIDGTIQPQ